MSTIASTTMQTILPQPDGGSKSAPRLAGPSGQGNTWILLLKISIALCLVGWIASDSLSDLLSLALNDAESSQVLLAPVVIAWLAWARRGRIAKCSLHGRWPGALIIAAGWCLWAQGYRYQIQSFWHFGAILLLGGIVLLFLGADALWKFLPAWAALVFLVPMPGRVHLYVAGPLERVTAILTQSLAEVLGINVTRSGNQLTVNGIDVCIAEACNGLRMVFSLFMACYVFAFARPFRPWIRFLVLAASPVVAIACNVIRLVPTVWMFGHASPATAERFHDLAGWAMLGVAFVLLTGFANLVGWLGFPVYSEVKQEFRATMTPPTNAKFSDAMGIYGWSAFARWLRSDSAATACAVIVIVGAMTSRFSLPRPEEATAYHDRVRSAADAIPLRIGDWVAKDVPVPSESTEQLHPNVMISRTIENTATHETASLLLVQSRDVRYIAPHYPPVCYPGAGLTETRRRIISIKIGDRTVEATRYSFESNTFRRGGELEVDNFMVLPDGTFQPDMVGMERRIGATERFFGAAQIQVIHNGNRAGSEETAATEAILAGYKPLIDAISHGEKK